MNDFSKKISLYDSIHDFWSYGIANDNIDYISDNKYISYFNKIFFNYLVKSYELNNIESLNQGNLKFHTNEKYKNKNTIPIINIESSILEEVLKLNKNYTKKTNLNDIRTHVPLVIDTQKNIIDILDNSEKYLYCLNQEMIHDSGNKITYNSPKQFTFYNEVEGQKRNYMNNILPGFFNIYFNGFNDNKTNVIYYNGNTSYINAEIKLNKNEFNTVKTIVSNIETIINKNIISYKTKILENSYAIFYNNRSDYNGLNFYNILNNEIDKNQQLKNYAFKLVLEYNKKRYGDQLQVLSCKKEIIYLNESNNKTYVIKNSYFVSIDKMAIAFAILNNVNCIYDKSIDINTDYEIYTFSNPEVIKYIIQPQQIVKSKKGGNRRMKTTYNIETIYDDPYILIDIAFPYNYKLFLNFKYYPVYTTKTQLRTLENDEILFMNEIYSKYDIFMYQDNILLYSIKDKIYWKEINNEELNILKGGNDIKSINNILNTSNVINTHIHNLIILYNIVPSFKHKNLNNFFLLLQDFLRFEIDSLINIEIKEQYFNQYKIKDNTLSLYLPHNTHIYFLIYTFYNNLLLNNELDINILLNIIIKSDEIDYSEDIKKYLRTIRLFYLNLPNNIYTIGNVIELNDYTPYNNIINTSYKEYISFNTELKNKNLEERILVYINNNITINSVYKLINEYINYILLNNKSKKINHTYRQYISVKGGKRIKTRKIKSKK